MSIQTFFLVLGISIIVTPFSCYLTKLAIDFFTYGVIGESRLMLTINTWSTILLLPFLWWLAISFNFYIAEEALGSYYYLGCLSVLLLHLPLTAYLLFLTLKTSAKRWETYTYDGKLFPKVVIRLFQILFFSIITMFTYRADTLFLWLRATQS